jgi:hypothetical protein
MPDCGLPISDFEFVSGNPPRLAPNPKSDYRSTKQTREPKAANPKPACGRQFGTFEFASFEFVSDFVFRASNFRPSNPPSEIGVAGGLQR